MNLEEYVFMAAKTSQSSITKRSKKKTNLQKLSTTMNKLAHDAVDKEVVKRFKTYIDTSSEDISKANLDQILKNSEDLVLSSYNESLQPYIKHYLFMKKREEKREEKK